MKNTQKDERKVISGEAGEILDFECATKKNRRECARRWIDAASIHLPVVEIGKRHSKNVNYHGGIAVIYGLMKCK